MLKLIYESKFFYKFIAIGKKNNEMYRECGVPKDKIIKSPLYINHASVNEIAKRLKGVGKKIAQRIVNTREQGGDFKRLEDLKAVPGMGSAKIQGNKEIISFDLPKPKE